MEKVRSTLEKCISDKSIDAWFFNDAEMGGKGKTDAEKYLNSILPGKWKFIEITGNGTNVGEGWFVDKEHGVTISLSCNNDGETDFDYIDGYTIK